MKLAIALVVLVAACGKDFVPPTPADEAAEKAAERYAGLSRAAQEAKLAYMVLDYSGLPPAERAKKAAPQVAPLMLASWDPISEQARTMAKTAGVDRARGKANPLGYADAVTMLDELSAQAPALAAKWSPLKTEVAALEQAAYTTEHDDKRPRVFVWTHVSEQATADQLLATTIVDCIVPSLEKKWPDVKFISESHRVDGPSIELVVKTIADKYKSTKGDTTKIAAGGAIALAGHELTGPIATALAEPITATASVSNPDEIKSDLGLDPVMEETKVGMDAIKSTQKQLCAGVEKELAAR